MDKELDIVAELQRRKQMPKIVEKTIPGLGKVKIRRIGGIEGMGYADAADAILKAVQKLDGSPLFPTREEAAEDFAVMKAIWAAYMEVNSIPSPEQASKN